MNKSDIKKKYVVYNKGKNITFILTSEHYDNRLSYFIDLFEEAKKDFPDLVSKYIKAYQYGGDTHKGQRGLEFSFDMPYKIPDGYVDGIRLTDTV